MKCICDLMLVACLAGACGFIEHPEVNDWAAVPDFLKGHPSIWRSRVMATLKACPGCILFLFHQCVFGQVAVKPTKMLLLNMQPFVRATRARGKRGFCAHPPGFHGDITGKDDQGHFKSAPTKIYTSQMCEALADSAIQHLLAKRAMGHYAATTNQLPHDLKEYFIFSDFYGADALDHAAALHQPDYAAH